MGLGGAERVGLQGSSLRVYFVQVPLSVEYLGNRYFIGETHLRFLLFDCFLFSILHF